MTGEEAHHLLNVVRIRVGEEVALLDGSGEVAQARLTAARRGEATLQVLGRQVLDLEPARALTIACALPRSSRMDFLVEKCAELGVRRLAPMVCARSVVDPTDRQENHLRRWRRTVIEAAKQSGRTRLTEIAPVVALSAVPLGPDSDTARMIASPESNAISLAAFRATLGPKQGILALIGPEGGFTDEELSWAKAARCAAVSLGPRILRVETAVVAVAACLLLD